MDKTVSEPVTESQPGMFRRASDWLYKNLVDGGPATVSVVERIDQPMTWWESAKNTVVSAVKGSVISATLGALAGAAIGAFAGARGTEGLANTLATKGSVDLGGANLPGIGAGPGITISGESMQSFAATNPTGANMTLSAIDQGVNLASKGALVGGVIGAIKGGWVDRITKEREIVAAKPLERQ